MAEKSEKMTKQELRAPDAFQLYGAEASEWLMKRRDIIGTVVVVVILGGLIAALINYFSTRGEEQASKQLGLALKVLQRPVEGAAPEDTGAPAEEPFKTQQEKDEAVRKSLTDFRAEHEGTRAAVTAALPLAKAEYRLGNYDAAIAAFDAFLAEAPATEPLRASALEGKGYTYEAKGQPEQALSTFEEMTKVESGEYLQGMGQYHRARMLVLLERKDEAAQVLADLKATQPTTAAGRMATERLAVLAAQGVKVPEPKATSTQDAG